MISLHDMRVSPPVYHDLRRCARVHYLQHNCQAYILIGRPGNKDFCLQGDGGDASVLRGQALPQAVPLRKTKLWISMSFSM